METTTVALLGGAVVLVAVVAGLLWRRRSSGPSATASRARTDTTAPPHESTATPDPTTEPADSGAPSTTEPADRDARPAGLAADVEKQLSEPVARSTTATPPSATTATSTTDDPQDSGSLDDLWAESTTFEGDGDDLDAASEALLSADTDLDDDWEEGADGTTAGADGLFESSGTSDTEDYRAAAPDSDGKPDDDLDSLFS